MLTEIEYILGECPILKSEYENELEEIAETLGDMRDALSEDMDSELGIERTKYHDDPTTTHGDGGGVTLSIKR